MNPMVPALYLSGVVLSASVLLGLYRVIVGPTLRDRAVALGLISTIIIGLIAVAAVETTQELLLDTVLVWAVLSFIGTVAFAMYLERR